MNLLARFAEEIRTNRLFLPSENLLLAVSGGMDSIVLCELCKQAGYPFAIAHANFKLRGAESDRDEAFVKAAAEKYNVKLYLKRFDTLDYLAEHKTSVQVAARELRYQWFNDILSGQAIPGIDLPKWLLTAHHADDNIETMLLHFFRGTGISGIRGMLPRQDKIIRPLLCFSKAELLSFAGERQLQWVEDSSNASDKYSRNYFRHALIPLVNTIFPEAEKNLRNNLLRFRETEIIYNQAIELRLKKLLTIKGNETHIPVLALTKTEPLHTIVYEIIKRFDFSPQQVKDVRHLLDASQGKYIESPTHRIIKNRNWLIIAPRRSPQPEHILIEAGDSSAGYENQVLTIEYVDGSKIKIPSSDREACLDARFARFPLMLRKWKQGDYFYPLGMKKKKKVARFLIDKKISPTEKEAIRVLESADKKILWIVGLRIDDRFKVTAGTTNAIRLSISDQEAK